MSEFAAVVLSAGSGKRMNSDIPKQYMHIHGRPVIYYSLKALEESGFSTIVLVCSEDYVEYCQKEIVERYGFSSVKAVVPGGKERYHSVYEGLKAIDSADYVMIHDGARPMLNQAILTRLKDALKEKDAVVAGMPVKDTIKIVDEKGCVKETPARKYVWQVQTPQCFAYPLIYDAYKRLLEDEKSGVPIPEVTDDAMVLSYSSDIAIRMVEADYRNIKITTPEDMLVAEQFLQSDL